MLTGQYISYKQILAKIYRDTQINSEIPESDVIEWISEALLRIGAFSQFTINQKKISICGGKGVIPCGFYKLIDINYNGAPVYWATQSNATNYACDDCNIPVCSNGKCEYTFYLNGNYIVTNINTDVDICINYLGIIVDDEGYPMIPEDTYFLAACSAYVIMMLDFADFRRGKISDKVYEESKFNWGFYVNSARGAANMPGLQQLERLRGIISRLGPQGNEYRNGFRTLGQSDNLNLRR